MESVKVFVRIRPANSREQKEGAGEGWVSHGAQSVSVGLKGKQNDFGFDVVFGPEATQEEVFGQVKDSVADVLDGLNATVFCYGQTGAGKSHTMFGSATETDLAGVIPRAAAAIFSHIAESSEDREFSIRASFLEIYREQLRDLLSPSGKKLAIREHKQRIWVENLSEEYVAAADDVMELIRQGERLRATSSTGMNETSSRSHSVFMLTVESKPTSAGAGGAPPRRAVLNLIDLAGSERVGKTGATGQTLAEAKKINQSLSALGNVINALSSGKADHVPYRDSQLTRLLQESLGGNCKTRLIVCCSPHGFNAEETLSSLRFGQRAKTLKNKVHKNEEESPEMMRATIEALRAAMEVLRTSLSEWQAYAKRLEGGGVAPGERPSEGLAEAVEATSMGESRRLDDLENELSSLKQELGSSKEEWEKMEEGLRAALEEKTAQLESALERERLAEEKRKEVELVHAQAVLELNDELEDLRRARRLSGPVHAAEGGTATETQNVWKEEMDSIQTQLKAARQELLLTKTRLEDRVAELEKESTMQQQQITSMQDRVSRQEWEEAQRELAELRIWKEAQEKKRARLFRPLKSGSGGSGKVAAAMAETLDHAVLKTRLKSTGKKLWHE